MKHKGLLIAGGVVAAIIILILIAPLFIDANQFRPRIESDLSTSLNRKVQIGNIHLSFWSGKASMDGVSISDDPSFSSGPFLTAKSLKVGVDLIPLIFSKRLHIDSFTIDQPEVTLLRKPDGMWNYASLGSQSNSTPANTSTSNSGPSTDISVEKLSLKDGKLSVGDMGKNTKAHEYDNVNVEASNLSYSTQFPFSLEAATPGNGSVKLKGQMGPLNSSDMEQTPFHANLEVKNFDLASTGFVDPSTGLGGLLDFSGIAASDGKQFTSKGTITANNLRVTANGSPARVPVKIDYDTTYELKPQTGTLNQGDVHLGDAVAHLTGTYNMSGDTPALQMKLNGQNMPAKDLQSVLPAVGVTLPSGTSLQTGAMNADLTINGPVNRLVIAGPVNLSNAKLANFNLGSKLGSISALAGVSKNADTTIQTFSTTVRVAPEGIRSDAIDLVVEGVGTLTGSGTVSANQALNFKMVAKPSDAHSVAGGISDMASVIGGKQNGGGIPFLIEGTTSDPKFAPDLKGLVKGIVPSKSTAVKQAQSLGGGLGGLLGGKKP